MTNQEAIKILDNLKPGDYSNPYEKGEAIVMAISALKAQEAKAQLSREDTTSGVKQTCITCKYYSPEIKWPCIDCDMRVADRWESQELSKNSPKLDKENGELQPTFNQLATDVISRQDTIDRINEYIEEYSEIDSDGNHSEKWCAMQEAKMTIENMPSAQPERKGKWVGYDGDWLKTMCKCSKCGAMIDINEKYRNFFCYHCGARMDGEQDE